MGQMFNLESKNLNLSETLDLFMKDDNLSKESLDSFLKKIGVEEIISSGGYVMNPDTGYTYLDEHYIYGTHGPDGSDFVPLDSKTQDKIRSLYGKTGVNKGIKIISPPKSLTKLQSLREKSFSTGKVFSGETVDIIGLDEISAQAKNVANTIENTRMNIEKTIDNLSTSWVGKDCDAYINSVKNSLNRITNIEKALQLLSTTCEKASSIATDTITTSYQIVSNNEG